MASSDPFKEGSQSKAWRVSGALGFEVLDPGQ